MTRKVALLLVLAGLTAGCGRYLAAGVAVVNGESISMGEFEARVAEALGGAGEQPGDARRQLERQVIAQMIQEELVRQEVLRRKIGATESEVEARLGELRRTFPSEDEFLQALASQSLTIAELRDRIRDRIALDRLRELLSGAPMTDAVLRAAYDEKRSEFEEIDVSHILFRVETPAGEARARTAAQAALARIRAGEDFAAVAREVSEDPGTKEAGGDLGTVTRGRFVPEFERAAFTQPAGDVSAPVRTQFGFHLILVRDRRVKPFAEVREQLRQEILQERGEPAFQTFLERSLRTAEIVVNPRFGAWDPRAATVVPRRFFVPASPETRANP